MSEGPGGRMSRRRKTTAVLQLLRGEDFKTVSRGLGVTAAALSGWLDIFLAAGEAFLSIPDNVDVPGLWVPWWMPA